MASSRQEADVLVEFIPSPELYPFESKWFDSSVGPVHYIDEGAGRPIVFSHGQPMWSFLYRHIVIGLRDRFRCVVIDYPGYGLSVRPYDYGYTPKEQAGVLGELVDELGLEDMVVMGQDWGGPIVMSMATARSDRVTGIVLGNTWFWRARTAMRLFSRYMATQRMQRRIIEDNWFVEAIPKGVATGLSDAAMGHYRAVQPTPEARVALAIAPKQLVAAGDWLDDLESQVKANLASKPVLLVWGMKDQAFPRKVLTRIKEVFTDRVVVELPNAEHYIQEDAPDEIIAAIIDRHA